MCGFCNMWACVCVGFVMCVYMSFVIYGFVCMDFVICECLYVLVLYREVVYVWIL
jgi:hypothetical protein